MVQVSIDLIPGIFTAGIPVDGADFSLGALARGVDLYRHGGFPLVNDALNRAAAGSFVTVSNRNTPFLSAAW